MTICMHCVCLTLKMLTIFFPIVSVVRFRWLVFFGFFLTLYIFVGAPSQFVSQTLLRASIFPTWHIHQIVQLSKANRVDCTVMSYAIELVERIFDTLLKNFTELICRTQPRLLGELFRNCESTIMEPTFEPDQECCMHLLRYFFSGITDPLVNNFKRKQNSYRQKYLELSYRLITITAFGLAVKMHDNTNNRSDLKRLKMSFRRKLFIRTESNAFKFFNLLENRVLTLLQFNLHIDPLFSCVEVLLAKREQVNARKPMNLSTERVNHRLALILANFYESRFSLARSVFFRHRQFMDSPKWILLSSKNLRAFESYASDKFIAAAAILIAATNLNVFPSGMRRDISAITNSQDNWNSIIFLSDALTTLIRH